MRNIIEVANKMKDMFESKEAKEEIQLVIRSASFTAPELMHERWIELHEVMISNLPEDKKQWSDKDLEIVSVFSTNSIEEIKAEIDSQ